MVNHYRDMDFVKIHPFLQKKPIFMFARFLAILTVMYGLKKHPAFALPNWHLFDAYISLKMTTLRVQKWPNEHKSSSRLTRARRIKAAPI